MVFPVCAHGGGTVAGARAPQGPHLSPLSAGLQELPRPGEPLHLPLRAPALNQFRPSLRAPQLSTGIASYTSWVGAGSRLPAVSWCLQEARSSPDTSRTARLEGISWALGRSQELHRILFLAPRVEAGASLLTGCGT